MSDLNIAATDRTPEIQLSVEQGIFNMRGESFPEDVAAFYGQVILAIDSLSSSMPRPLAVNVAMVYINSSSIKAMFRIFEGLENIRKNGQSISITWHFQDDDDIMQELGEDFKDRFPDLPITVQAS
jgi:SiaC family regulatory phosphoprotein